MASPNVRSPAILPLRATATWALFLPRRRAIRWYRSPRKVWVRAAPLAAWPRALRSQVSPWPFFPDRVRALALEAFHFRAWKPGSLDFFRTGSEDPGRFGEAIAGELEADHGPDWSEVIRMESRAWLRIIEAGRHGQRDLYRGRLSEIRCPALLLHGRRDPRTEPGEMEDAQAALPGARLAWLEAGHSPHTSAAAGAECTRLALEFLEAAPP